jgi:hypothetical protein
VSLTPAAKWKKSSIRKVVMIVFDTMDSKVNI